MLWNVVSLACLGLLAVITYFVKDLPVYFREMKLEQSRARNSQELLREAYFRGNWWRRSCTNFKRLVVNFISFQR